MAAYDNVDLPGSPRPANYAPPLLDFSALGKLAQDYQQGEQYGVKRGIQTSFQDGVPPNQDGSPNYGAMAERLLKIGGPEAAQPYFNLAMQQQNQADFNSIDPQNGRPTAHVASGQPSASGPANNTGATPSGDPGSNPAPNTLRGLLTAGMGPQDAARLLHPAMSKSWATMLGGQVGPDDQLSDTQVQSVIKRFPQLAQAARQGQQEPQPGGGPPFATGTPSVRNPQKPNANAFGEGEDILPPNSETSSRDAAVNGPTQAGPRPTQRQGGVSADPEIMRSNAVIRRAASYLSRPGLTDGQKDGANKTIATAQEAIKQRTEFINKQNELTPKEKEAGPNDIPTYEGNVEASKEAAKRYDKMQAEISKGVTEAGTERPQLALIKQIMSDPQFISGAGSGLVQKYRQWTVALGGDPNAAVPQEAFSKAVQNLALSQIRAMAGTGPVRVAEMRIIQQAIANKDYTPATNRLLIEIADRNYARNQQIGTLARQYTNGPGRGRLGPGFEDVVAKSDTVPTSKGGTRLFEDHELNDPRTIAPPIYRSKAEAEAALPPGEPYKGTNGRLFMTARPAP